VRPLNLERLVARLIQTSDNVSVDVVKDIVIAQRLVERFRYRESSNLNDSRSRCVVNFFDYHPRRGGRNPLHDDIDDVILGLKAGNDRAVHLFGLVLDEILPRGLTIAVVPSHQAGAIITSGIERVARVLVKLGACSDAIGCVARTATVPKLSWGGSRDYDGLHGSLRVQNGRVVNGRDVLLLDDVMTSGNSLSAAAAHVAAAGARSVVCVALGRTV
jgi:hypothetical protein